MTEEHTSKSVLLLQGAELVLQRHQRRRDIGAGLDFLMSHDAELLKRLEDALQVVDRYGFHVRDIGLLASALARPANDGAGCESISAVGDEGGGSDGVCGSVQSADRRQ